MKIVESFKRSYLKAEIVLTIRQFLISFWAVIVGMLVTLYTLKFEGDISARLG